MARKVLFILFLMLISSGVYCCDCSEKPSIKENWELASQVFIGKVIKIDSSLYSEYGQKMYSYTVKISKTYKDEVFKEQYFRTILGVNMGSCDYYFENGKEYLIYAKKDHNSLGCSICSRTNLLQNIQSDELKLLDELYRKSRKNRNGIQIIQFQNNIQYQIDLVKNSFEEKLKRKDMIIYVLSALNFILIFLLILVFFKNKRIFKSGNESNFDSK
ncbi:hypothetical protein HNP37_000684 [Flavobacterium nitrogenifigens]|uniref:Tissue inhibitor of metalloproteinase n=2 Tax=Flavobacterium TaxID=237 RepID=A0A7W7N5D4_9FLAO|nr:MULTISPECIES: hypothetical protein [Flavobacterium]MBB4800645.1 hypothetical protein [Flavobacterium nitrogenifigens]MBB6385608.1 hypothetical protein [Flavobacterium notoginsengisoli]